MTKKGHQGAAHRTCARMRAPFAQVFEARDLKNTGALGSTPYCKMYLLPDKNKKTKKKTTPRKGTVNPFWEEEFRWSLPNFEEHKQRTLEITLCMLARPPLFASFPCRAANQHTVGSSIRRDRLCSGDMDVCPPHSTTQAACKPMYVTKTAGS